MPTKLETLHDDVLIHIFSFLTVPEVVLLRQACKRMNTISRQRIVWVNACTSNILDRGYPFPRAVPLDLMSVMELEIQTRHAHRLSSGWLSGFRIGRAPRMQLEFYARSSTGVKDVYFVPGHGGKFLLTISKGIWFVITVWDITGDDPDGACKCSEWSPRGVIIKAIAFNTDKDSQATLALSVLKDGSVIIFKGPGASLKILGFNRRQFVEILSLGPDGKLSSIGSVDSDFRAVAFQGDILALCTEICHTSILNWRTGASALLQHPPDEDGFYRHDHCIQVVFAHNSILVVRAHSIYLFPHPTLSDIKPSDVHWPLAHHSFGWIDGVSVTDILSSSSAVQPLSILIRAESDNPWAAGVHSLQLYTLHPNPTFNETHDIPYVFPPVLSNQISSVRGSLRCMDVILGRYGTALWIQPPDRGISGLLSDELFASSSSPSNANQHESLVAAVFPGPLNPSPPESKSEFSSNNGAPSGIQGSEGRVLCTNRDNNWTAFDYDEERGRVALGSTVGRVSVLQL